MKGSNLSAAIIPTLKADVNFKPVIFLMAFSACAVLSSVTSPGGIAPPTVPVTSKDAIKDYPQSEKIALFASFEKREQAEMVKTGIPLKWSGLYEFKKDDGLNGKGAILTGTDGFAEIDRNVIDPENGTIAFWFKPSGDPIGGSHTYLSWSWNNGSRGGNSYMVISQGWWEEGGGAGSTYGIFCNGQPEAADRIASSEKAGMWNHYALSWKKREDNRYEMTFYRNGLAGNTVPADAPQKEKLQVSTQLFLGSDKGSCMANGRYANGFFNEFIIWNTVLGSEEIKGLILKKAPDYVVKGLKNSLYWMDDAKDKPYREKRDANGVLLESRVIFAQGIYIHYQDKENILKDIDRLKNSGFNVYMSAVWQGEGMECGSKTVKTTQRYQDYQKSNPGFDPYGFFIEEMHKKGMEVQSAFCEMLGDGANGYDPKHRDFIVNAILDHIVEYPVDGIVHDFVRIMGGLDTPVAAEEYKRLYGRDLNKDRNSPELMTKFASDCVGDIVRRVSVGVKKIRPGVLISCCADSQTAKHGLAGSGRNPRLWIEKGWIDTVINMDYGRRLGVEVFDVARKDAKKPYAWVEGIGNYEYENGKLVSRDPKMVASLMDYCRRKYNDGNGTYLYFWSCLSDEHIAALRAGPFKELAKPSWRR